MSNFRGYEIEIDFNKRFETKLGFNNLPSDEWGVLLIKGERSHFMTFNVARTLSSVENDIYNKIDELIEQEKKR